MCVALGPHLPLPPRRLPRRRSRGQFWRHPASGQPQASASRGAGWPGRPHHAGKNFESTPVRNFGAAVSEDCSGRQSIHAVTTRRGR